MKQLLKDIANVGAGQGAPQGDSNYCDYGTPFVKAGNLQELLEGKAITDIQKVSEEVAEKHRLRLYSSGTILFAKSGMSCMKGYVYVLPQDAYVVSHLACITPNNDTSEYLRYYFKFHKPNQLVKDAAYPSISLADIGNLEIDMKTDSAREQIVSQLQHAESVIALRQQELQKLDELVKTQFIEMFGDPVKNEKAWEMKPINELYTVGSSKRIYASELASEGIPFLRVSDICSMIDGENVLPSLYISSDKYNELRKNSLVPTENDILVTARGTIGRCYVIGKSDKFYFQDGMVTWLKKKSSLVEPVYITNIFASKTFAEVLDKATNKTTVHYISIDKLASISIPVPPIEIQKQFAALVQQSDKSRFAIRQALEKSQMLLDGLMQKYFG